MGMKYVGFLLILISCSGLKKYVWTSKQDIPEKYQQKVVEAEPKVTLEAAVEEPVAPNQIVTVPKVLEAIEHTEKPVQQVAPVVETNKIIKKVELTTEKKLIEKTSEVLEEKKMNLAEIAHPKYPYWTAQKWPFKIGEKFTYLGRYGFIQAGEVSIKLDSITKVDSRPALKFVVRAKSSKLLNVFYKIDNKITSWVDLNHFLPLRFKIEQNESRYQGMRIVKFDPVKQLAYYFDKTKDLKKDKLKKVEKTIKLKHYPQDIIGGAYFTRFIKDRSKINFPIYDRYKNWANELIFVKKENIKVAAGRFPAIQYKVKPRVQGSYKPRGDVSIWVSDDDKHILLQAKIHIPLGAFTAELKSYNSGHTAITENTPRFLTPTKLSVKGEL